MLMYFSDFTRLSHKTFQFDRYLTDPALYHDYISNTERHRHSVRNTITLEEVLPHSYISGPFSRCLLTHLTKISPRVSQQNLSTSDTIEGCGLVFWAYQVMLAVRAYRSRRIPFIQLARDIDQLKQASVRNSTGGNVLGIRLVKASSRSTIIYIVLK